MPKPSPRQAQGPVAAVAAAAAAPPGVQTADEKVAAVLEQLGQAASTTLVRLFRMLQGKPAFLDRLQLTADLYEQVQLEHGGGDYYAAVIGSDGKIITQFYFTIFGTAKIKPNDLSPAPAPVVAEPSRTEQLLLEVLEQLRKAPASVAPVSVVRDPIEDFTKMMAAVNATRREEQRDSVLDQVNMLLAIQERLGGTGGGGDSGLLVVARELGKPALELLTRAMNREDQAAAAVPHLSPSNPVTPAREPVALPAVAPMPMRDDVPQDADPIVKLVASVPVAARRVLGSWAETGADPVSCANRILAMLEDEQYAQLAEQILRPDFAIVFAGAVPRYRPHLVWFQQLTDAIRASMPDDEPAADNAGGDAGAADSSGEAPRLTA